MMKIIKSIFLLSFLLITLFIQGQESTHANIAKSIKVFGACEQCKSRIENSLKLKGIKKAIWDVDSQMLDLVYDSAIITLNKIENKIIAVGHDLENKKAKDIIYKELPACCHYRELDEELNQDLNHKAIESSTLPLISMDSLSHEKGIVVSGVVLQDNKNGKFEPLSNASVYWSGTKNGVLTDSFGVFSINVMATNQRLVISYVGYKADTISVANYKDMKIILAAKNQLNEVTVFSRPNGTFIPYLSTIRTQVMTGTELLKAACCNLSESFETNPSVDVSFNDAITGSKQIQLLGLSGNYTQLTVENLPGPRGLATLLGLNSIAGPWIESIQLTKGVGSVANGYESIAGQINVELKKPETAERLLANVYVNDFGKTDLNVNLSQKINSKWSSGLLLHDDFLNNKQLDFNNDGFRDLPTGNQFGLVNRYKFDNSKGWLAQFGIKVLNDNKVGGETAFDPAKDKNTSNHYGLGINTERYELFGKIGYVFPQQKYKSIGLQLAAIDHQQDAYFGLTTYNAKQQSFYGNLIYQSIINSTIHKFRTGLSFQYDKYNENLNLLNYNRKEIVPGAFFEYTFTPTEQFSMVAGLRADNNNLYGSFITPRLNVRYEPIKGTTFRLSAGRGQRTANILAENNSVLVSARQLNFENYPKGVGYGLNPEIAWNKGVSFDQKFKLFNNSASLGIDYFRNGFENQVVVDLENARTIHFYNLKGKSFSNSVQAELNVQPAQKLDVKMAFRYFDVQQTYQDNLLDRPMISKNRAFLSVDYATNNSWKFNYTITYNGRKRIPNTTANPALFELPAYSPSFVLMNTQVTKAIGKLYPMEVYMGIENITNYYQQNPILSASTPFSPYFDASLVWGPTTGRMFYFGWRLKIK
jgi:outer membrane receptor for ferrienterochelin and colicins